MDTSPVRWLVPFFIRTFATENINMSNKPTRKFVIDRSTNYKRHENILVDVEAYYYGKMVDAGGKDKANIHLDTKETGLLTIKTDKDYLAGIEGNPLYREFGVRVKAKQNILTGDIDKSTLELIKIFDYSPKFDRAYLDRLIAKAAPKWKGIDANAWLKEIRGSV